MAQIKTAGVILAGGRSSRFGSNKALALLQNKPLIAHTVEALSPCVKKIYIVHRETLDLSSINLSEVCLITDLLQHYHPLGGIYSALRQIDASSLIITACDQPGINAQYLDFLIQTPLDYDLAVGCWNNHIEPFPGLYRKNLLAPLEKLINKDNVGLQNLIEQSRSRIYAQDEISSLDPLGLSFQDIDTPQDLKNYAGASV